MLPVHLDLQGIAGAHSPHPNIHGWLTEQAQAQWVELHFEVTVINIFCWKVKVLGQKWE